MKGRSDYDRLHPLSYPQTVNSIPIFLSQDIFLLAFSVVPNYYRDQTREGYFNYNLDRLKNYWFAEVAHHCPKTPVILVGTRVDMREDKEVLDKLAEKNGSPLTKEDGIKLAKEIGCIKYMECRFLSYLFLLFKFIDWSWS